MFCPKCGSSIPASASFCRECGSKIGRDGNAQAEAEGSKKSAPAKSATRTQPAAKRTAKLGRRVAVAIASVVAVLAVAMYGIVPMVTNMNDVSPLSETGAELEGGLSDDVQTALEDAKSIAYALASSSDASEADGSAADSEQGESATTAEEAMNRLDADQGVIDAALDTADDATRSRLEAASLAIDSVRESFAFQLSVLEVLNAATTSGQEGSLSDSAATAANYISAIKETLGSDQAPSSTKSIAGCLGNSLDPAYAAMATLYSGAATDTLSQFDLMTVTEVMDYVQVELAQYGEMLDDAWQASYEVAGDILGGESSAPSFECELTTEIYPNLYPSNNSIANIAITVTEPHANVIVEAQVDGFTQKYEQRHELDAGYTYLMVKPAPLSDLPDLSNSKDTQLTLKITDADTGETYVQKSEPVRLHSVYDVNWYTDDFGTASQFNILSWLRPESETVQAVNRAAIEWLEQAYGEDAAILPGYQNGYGLPEIDTVAVQVGAIQAALSNYGLRYKTDSYSFDAQQHVLTPDQVVASKSGLCIETSLLMASCLESLGMHAILSFPPGHAQVLVETWQDSGQYLLVETTTLPYSGFAFAEDGGVAADQLIVAGITADNFNDYLVSYGCETADDLYVVDCDLRAPMGMQGLESI